MVDEEEPAETTYFKYDNAIMEEEEEQFNSAPAHPFADAPQPPMVGFEQMEGLWSKFTSE